ncbi:Deoxycytidine kinase 1 [Knufia obscura]|uniref:Deoxycytidine kinase 1 n=2 Tax=Knufia TaxID=430999 RepID=A0AAN8ETN2_9EURO|nr:Deoxycytidine kinase 1 [Knufia obscura]KAK5958673.1 Deoxycytidine kinase 1 [Knufia fluminis]
MPWRPIPLSYAIAIYPFQPSTSPAELPLQIGDQLYVIEQGGKDGAWCRGYLVQQPSLLSTLTPGSRGASDARVFSGIFPRCCIDIREQLGHNGEQKFQPLAQGSNKPQAPVPMLKIGDESPTSASEPLVDEISSCLREWYVSYLPNLVLRQDYDRLDRVSEIVTQLDYARRQLLNDVLTAQERVSVRTEAVWGLVRGNKLVGAEVIVRDPGQKGRLLTANDSTVEMTKLQSVMSVLEDPPVAKQEAARLHHCMLAVNSTQSPDAENVNLSFALYEKAVDGTISQLSETFTASAAQNSKALFADLSSRDISSQGRLFLVARASVSEPPRMAPTSVAERPPSRNGTFNKTRESIINRRKSNMVFGSKRNKEKPELTESGRTIVRKQEASPDVNRPESTEAKKKPPGAPVPRTIGHAVYDIAMTIKSGQEEVFELEFWTAATGDNEEEEIAWPGLLPELLQVRNLHFVRCKTLSAIPIEIRPFFAPDAETLIRMNPTSMHMIAKCQRIGFSEAPTKRRSDIYFTLSKARIKQNGAYSHPQFGAVPVKAAPMLNLQTTMELRDSAGNRLERCIYASANGPAVTALRTHAVDLDSMWDQTICIRLPLEKVADAHIVLSVADSPGFPFALAWMPLWDKHAFRGDGQHSLILHAYDKSTSTFSDTGKPLYLNLGWDQTTIKEKDVPIASLEVKTQLVSTEFSQNRTLAGLFNWRALSSASLMDTLQKLVFVPEIEIVKQLDEVLDALFAALEYKAGTHKFEDLIFNDIVFVLGIVHDRRFNLGPLVERYADERFKAPLVAPSLVRSFTRLMQSVSDPQSARDLRALFKVGKQFMRLLMATYSHNKPGQNGEAQSKHDSFQEDMKAVFFGLQMMMRSETAALVGSKTLLTQNFHSWLPELLTVYSKDDVINFAIDIVDACDEATGKLSLYRLVLILNYTRIDILWEDDQDWNILIENCLRWLELHWPNENDLTENWRDQIRLCSSIVASLLTRPAPALHGFLPAIFSTYSTLIDQPQNKHWTLSLLFPTAYPFTATVTDSSDHFDEALLELSALVSEIMKIQPMPKRKLTIDKRTQHVSQALELVRSVLSDFTNPSSWLSLHISHHTAALKILAYVGQQLEEHYIPDPEDADSFNLELWKAYFDTTLSLVSSPALTLESFSEQKRRAVWKISGDVRQAGADLLRDSWSMLGWEATEDDKRRYNITKLGGYQVQYVPSLVGPVIQLCLSMHEGLRKVGVEILQTMIISEWALSEDLTPIETEVIGALNAILQGRAASITSLSGNEIVARKLFVGELLESFNTIANQPGDALWTTLEDLVSTIEELIDLLSGNSEDIDDEQEYHKSMGTRRNASVELPERSISRLEGKVYGDQALQMYKQLAEEYEKTGDYMRLAKTHRAMARIHETRATSRLGSRENGDHLNEEDE